MYKNIEILDKSKHQNMKFNTVTDIEVSKNIGLVPLGVDEILDMSSISPVIISAGENAEFVALTGISNTINIYKNEALYIPKFIKSYPFFNITVKDANDKFTRLIAIDKDNRFVGEDKENSIFTKDKELETESSSKIELVKQLDKNREISKKIVEELKEKNLLLKKDFRVNIDKTEKIVIEEFYIINREKLLELDDATLALWAKKGWMGIIDAHIKSLSNFQNILINR